MITVKPPFDDQAQRPWEVTLYFKDGAKQAYPLGESTELQAYVWCLTCLRQGHFWFSLGAGHTEFVGTAEIHHRFTLQPARP